MNELWCSPQNTYGDYYILTFSMCLLFSIFYYLFFIPISLKFAYILVL